MITNQGELRATCCSSQQQQLASSAATEEDTEHTTEAPLTTTTTTTTTDILTALIATATTTTLQLAHSEATQTDDKLSSSRLSSSTSSSSFRDAADDTIKREKEEATSLARLPSPQCDAKQQQQQQREWLLERNSHLSKQSKRSNDILTIVAASPATLTTREESKGFLHHEKGEKERERKLLKLSQPMNPIEAFKTAHHLLIVLASYAALATSAHSLNPNAPLAAPVKPPATLVHPHVALLDPQLAVMEPSGYFEQRQRWHRFQQQHQHQQYAQAAGNEQLRRSALVNPSFTSRQHETNSAGDLMGAESDARATRSQLEQQQQQQQGWLGNLLRALSESEQQKQQTEQRVNRNFDSPDYAILSAQQPPAEEQADHTSEQRRFRFNPQAQAQFSTAPTINRQLITPPQFYEIGLAPTNALQIELSGGASGPPNHAQAPEEPFSMGVSGEARSVAARSAMPFRVAGNADQLLLQNPQTQINSRSHEVLPSASQQLEPALEHQDARGGHQQQQGASDKLNSEQPTSPTSGSARDDDTSKLSATESEPKNSAPQSSDLTDNSKAVFEPRQRRRIFNRILKKAEWNHLFVELSKVFLRYFLDLALKDIIGKQSGAETTTSRKKLDAQSELTDLLKDFVKTAISNI